MTVGTVSKKKRYYLGIFPNMGGGVFPNPKTFVNLPSIFLYAKLGPKWPQMVKNMLYWSSGIILGPLRPLWDIGKLAMFGHFWPQKGHFGPLCAHNWRMAMAKTAWNQLGICLRIMHVRRMPKVSIFMAVTTKIVPEKAQKWPKVSGG